MSAALDIIGAAIALPCIVAWGVMAVSTKCYDAGYSHSPFDGTRKWADRLGLAALLGVALIIGAHFSP